MNRKWIVIVVIFLILAGGAGYKLFLKKEKGITATGTIEVTLADVVPKMNGYMSKLTIQVGDTVQAGQIITHIQKPELEAQLLADQSALAKAKVQLSDLEKGPRKDEIEQANANLAAAQSLYGKAQGDLERYRALYQTGAIAAQQIDTIQSNYDVAYNSLRTAQAQQRLLMEGNRQDVIEAQRLETERYQAIIAVTKANLADRDVVSPLTGVVLSKNYQNGEYVNPGSAIATIGDLDDCWVKIYISSEQLGLIKLGQSVDVKIDAYPEKVFAGTIKEISQNAEFTPRQSITQQERANLVFYVKVKINNSEGILKPGMPADVVIQ